MKINSNAVELHTRHQRETFVAGRAVVILVAILSKVDRSFAKLVESALPFIEWHFGRGREGSKMQNSATLNRSTGRVNVELDERQNLETLLPLVLEYLSRAIVRSAVKAIEKKDEDPVVMLPAKITGADDARKRLHVSGKPSDPVLDSVSAEWLATIIRDAGVEFPPVSRQPNKRGSGTAYVSILLTNSAGNEQRLNVKVAEFDTWIRDFGVKGSKIVATFDADAVAAARDEATKNPNEKSKSKNVPTTGRKKPEKKPVQKMTGATIDEPMRNVA